MADFSFYVSNFWIYISLKTSLPLVYRLILCGIMPSDELVYTVVYICAPLIFFFFFFTQQQGTEKAVRQRLNNSTFVVDLVLQKL